MICQTIQDSIINIAVEFNVHGSVHRKMCPTRCNVTRFVFSGNCSTCFRWYLHLKHVGQFPEKTNCVTLHLVGHILEYCSCTECQLWFFHPMQCYTVCFFWKLLHIFQVVPPPETCRAVSRKNKLCNIASLDIYQNIAVALNVSYGFFIPCFLIILIFGKLF